MVAAENEAIFEVMTKVYGGEELSENEYFRAARYFGSTPALFEYAYSQFQAGIIGEELYSSYEDDILLFTYNTDFSRSYWQVQKEGVTEGFRTYVDSLIAKQP